MPRLVGKQGVVLFVQGGLGLAVAPVHKIADLFNITFEVEQEVVECGIKLEVNETYALGRVNSRLTGERYITDTTTAISAGPPDVAAGGSVLASLFFAANIPAAGNNYLGFTVQWQFQTIPGTPATGKGFVVTGEGFIQRVTQNNPRGMASEVWEIQCTNSPSLAFAS